MIKGIRGVLDGIDSISKVLEIVWNNHGNVLISRLGNTMVVSDPVAIVMGMNFGLTPNNVGLKLVKEVCREEGVKYGNDFSMFVLFLNYLNKEVLKMSVGGVFPLSIYNYLEEEFDGFSKYIKSISVNTFSLEEVLSSVFPDSGINEIVSMSFRSVGKNGNIIVECGKGVNNECLVRGGIELPFGISKKIPSCEFNLDQPVIAVINSGLSSFKDVSSVIEESSILGRPIVIFSWFSEGEVIATWNLNKEINGNKWFYVDVSGIDRLDWLEDIASISGASVVDSSKGMDVRKFNNSWLGSVQSLVSDRNRTNLTCYDINPASLADRITSLRNQAAGASGYKRDKLLERASRLDEGYCVIRVGGRTTQEMITNRSLAERVVSFSNGLLESGYITRKDILGWSGDGLIRSIMGDFIDKEDETPIPSSILLDAISKSMSVSKEIMSSKLVYSSSHSSF